MKLTAIGSTIGRAPSMLKAAPKIADQFYLSPEWRRLMRDIKQERGAWCQRCGSNHRLIGDHIIEIKDGGERLDRSNIELLCQSCHNRKTGRARKARINSKF